MFKAALLLLSPLASAHTHLQYVGFPIETGYNAVVSAGGLFYGGNEHGYVGGTKGQLVPALHNSAGAYAGHADAKTDISKRVALLGQTLRKAASSPKIDNRSSTLKIFAAPEFFFRGAVGAYNMTTEGQEAAVHSLAEQLGALVAAPEWRDWLFFFGTTIAFETSKGQARRTVVGAHGDAFAVEGAYAEVPLVDTQNFAMIRRGGPNGEKHVHFKVSIQLLHPSNRVLTCAPHLCAPTERCGATVVCSFRPTYPRSTFWTRPLASSAQSHTP